MREKDSASRNEPNMKYMLQREEAAGRKEQSADDRLHHFIISPREEVQSLVHTTNAIFGKRMV